jgi:hypothetical protein
MTAEVVEARNGCEGLNEEQTATLETALLHAARCAVDRAGPDANRSAGLQSDRVVFVEHEPRRVSRAWLAHDAGFEQVQHVSAAMLAQRYLSGRTDGLRPPENPEQMLVATT